MSELVLQGPFLTRPQAAHRAGVPARLLVHRPDLLRLGGPWLQEVYFAFQFDQEGVRPDLGVVVHDLKGTAGDATIADWLVRPNHALHGTTPLGYLKGGGSVERVVAAARRDDPGARAAVTAPEADGGGRPAGASGKRIPVRRDRRRPIGHRWALGSR